MTIGTISNSESGLSVRNKLNEVIAIANETGTYTKVIVHNDTGGEITKGKIVYPSGESGGIVTVGLADSMEYDKSRFCGMANENIADGTTGEVLIFGIVTGINTATLTAGAPVYLTTDGNVSSTKLTGHSFVTTVGFCAISDASNGIVIMDRSLSEKTVESTDTNGFTGAERSNTTLSFDDGLIKFTITPTTSYFNYYQNGISYKQVGADSITLTNTEGLHVIFYNNGILESIANPNDGQIDQTIRTKCLVAYVYWDAVNSKHLFILDERHGISMSPDTHSALHFSRRTQWLQGIGLGDFVIGDGDTNTHAQFSSAYGIISDEDIIAISNAKASTVGCPIFYLDGASGNLRNTDQAGYSVLTDTTAGVGATGRAVFNEWTGSAWQLTTVPNNDFVLCHIFAYNSIDQNKNTIALIGQNSYTTLSLARAGANAEISNILSAIPLQEKVPIGTIIFQTSNGYTNAVKSRVVLTDTGDNYVDWRTSELAQGSAPSSHANLTDVDLAADGVAIGHISDQAQTIVGDKTFESLDYREIAAEKSTVEYYVDAAAPSEGDGTSGNPFKTLEYTFKQFKPKNHSGVAIHVKGIHTSDLDEYIRQKDFYFRVNFYAWGDIYTTSPIDSGTFTTGTGYSKKIDTGKSWTVNEHRGKVLKDTVSDKHYVILENTATALYIRGNTSYAAESMTTYQILDYANGINLATSDLSMKGAEFLRMGFQDMKLYGIGEIISDDSTIDFINCSISCESVRGIAINAQKSGFICSSTTNHHTVGFVFASGFAMNKGLVFQKSFYDNAIVSYSGSKISQPAFTLNQYAADIKNSTYEFKMADIYVRNFKAVLGIDPTNYYLGGKFFIGGFMDYENVDFIAIGNNGFHVDNDPTFSIYALNVGNLNIAPFSNNGTTEATNYCDLEKNYNALVLAQTGKQNIVSDSSITMKIDYENGVAILKTLNISNIPTSSGGLSSGDVWSDGGTLKIVT